jgi:hypothetical protein
MAARFSAPIQTSPGPHLASCTIGTRSFPGVKRPGRGASHPTPSRAEANKRVELYLYSPLVLNGLYRFHFTFTLNSPYCFCFIWNQAIMSCYKALPNVWRLNVWDLQHCTNCSGRRHNTFWSVVISLSYLILTIVIWPDSMPSMPYISFW